AFLYVTNWWYVLGDTSYFEATGRPPMLQHLWSLAVEEQFYLLWPVLCWLLWKVGRTRGIRVGAVVGALVSTAAMVWISVAQGMPEAADPSRVYFGSDTHAMTLLVGAALATVWKAARINAVVTARGRRAATGLGVVSLLALLATFWFVGYDSPLLYLGGFLVVGLITAGFVAAASVTSSSFATVLGAQPLRWIGERSYGIYLWHWPVFMVLRPGIDLDAEGLEVQALRLAITLALAELSYRYVETPIRHGLIGRAWTRWKEAGGFALAGRSAVAVVTTLTVVAALGLGLANARTTTFEETLGGVDGVGNESLTPLPSSTSPTPTPTTSATGTASPSPSPTSTRPSDRPELAAGEDAFGLSFTAVGDSVLLGARDSVLEMFPGSTVDATVSRPSWEVFQRILDRRAAGKLGAVVVIHTGTNGSIDEQQFDDLLQVLQDRSRVVLVTVKAPRSWTPEDNAIIRRLAAKYADGNVRLADWEDYSRGKRAWFYPDGIHMRPDGADAYAQLLREAISR
ncbi:acyltransferase family protein, partial [Longivirga aurantiaca]